MSDVSQIQAQIGALSATIAQCQETINKNTELINQIEAAKANVESAQANLSNVGAGNSFKWVADNMNNYWVVGDSSSTDYILNDSGTRGQVAQTLYSLNEMVAVDGGVIGGATSAVMSDAANKIAELEAEIEKCRATIESFQAQIQSLMAMLAMAEQHGTTAVEN